MKQDHARLMLSSTTLKKLGARATLTFGRLLPAFVLPMLVGCQSGDLDEDADLPEIGTSESSLNGIGDTIPIGIANVNDSPLKQSNYRALLRFVPRSTVTIDRFYFGFKLKGASCDQPGAGGYGGGNGGTLVGAIVNIDASTGLPTTTIASESVSACARFTEAKNAVGGRTPVMLWVSTGLVTLQADTMYGLIVRNSDGNPASNFFSFNMPYADTAHAGPHARNELSKSESGAIMSLDPREHVAWSTNSGATWSYGTANGQYTSYVNEDPSHPGTKLPQYGWRRSDGVHVAQQPYYAYDATCSNCTVTYANVTYARTFTQAGAFTTSGADVGTVTLTNTSTGQSSTCTPTTGYGFRTCTLATPVSVAVGDSYTVRASGTVALMKMDYQQRTVFSNVGTSTGELRWYQASPASGTNAKDVPSIWAGPHSAYYASTDPPTTQSTRPQGR
ncbi:hypothetical protein SOCE26_020400 [Sorangium cellulosum]|uniref:Uncharacterized protein n=1 Tax=Sorangium cellulosum TaxID=56 RepID=A0A2L0EMW9_SORCE|nr:hypothetical protein [Sorangium cellulosum]AUX40639.1 hypothetical protein SOCE26_020400 [Sorangium cellulosum]